MLVLSAVVNIAAIVSVDAAPIVDVADIINVDAAPVVTFLLLFMLLLLLPY